MAVTATPRGEIAGPMIYQAINNVMADVGAVTKDSVNTFDKYKFRGIDAVLNALNPALKKHGVTIVPTVLAQEREERLSKDGKTMIYSVLTINYKFYALDGSFIEATVVGEGMDRGDKSSNKAMSAAFKYAAFQTFCLPTEEMLDSEADSPEVQPKGAPSKKPPLLTKGQAEQIKKLLEETDSDVKTFLNYFKSATVDTMPASSYNVAIEMLNKKKAKKEAQNA